MQGCKDARMQGCKDARMQGCKDARMQGCKDARMQGCKDARMQGCKDARMQGCKDARMQGCKDARTQGRKDARMQGCKDARMQGCMHGGRYAVMQTDMHVDGQECRRTGIQRGMRADIQPLAYMCACFHPCRYTGNAFVLAYRVTCRNTGMLACRYVHADTCMQACRDAGMQGCRYGGNLIRVQG